MAGIFVASSIPNPPVPSDVSDVSLHEAAYFGLTLLLIRALARGDWRGVTLTTLAVAWLVAVAYGASKAALEQVLAAWRHEHAPKRFSCVAIGATMPTEVSNGFDPDLLSVLLEDWMATGSLQLETMVTDDLAYALLGVFAAALPVPGVNLEHLTVRTPTADLGSWAATRSSP
mgnify:CR=1 FL=1